METGITLIQGPVIQHHLAQAGRSVTDRLSGLNIANLVATGETIQSLKNMRAELNKELTGYEAQRKAIKQAISVPYSEFEEVYKKEVSEKYKQAIDTLKDKIAEFEDRLKTQKKADVTRYFNELCQAGNIDFLKFENTGIEINLSTSGKQYKEKCNDFVSRVTDDLILVNTMAYPAEITAEYKKNGLNASAAIKTINDRKEAERLETERIKLAETQRRESLLRNLSMIYHDLTKTFNWVGDENLFISRKDIEGLPAEDFRKRFVELESRIKARQSQSQPAETRQPETVQAPEVKQPAGALKAPVEEKQPEAVPTFTASFQVIGTMAQLKALGQYMKDNGITYKNI